MAEGGAGPPQHEVLLEAFRLPLGGRYTRRPHAGFAGHRCRRRGAAYSGRTEAEEDVPAGQLAVPTQGDDRLIRRAVWIGWSEIATRGIAHGTIKGISHA